MQRLLIDKLRLGSYIWFCVTIDAFEVGLLIGGFAYGGLILPFFLTVHRGFYNFFGSAILGLGVSIPMSAFLALITGIVTGFIVAILTVSSFYPLNPTKFYVITMGLVSVVISTLMMTLTLTLLHNAPYYAYATFNWAGSDIMLITLAGISGGVVIFRLIRWFNTKLPPVYVEKLPPLDVDNSTGKI